MSRARAGVRAAIVDERRLGVVERLGVVRGKGEMFDELGRQSQQRYGQHHDGIPEQSLPKPLRCLGNAGRPSRTTAKVSIRHSICTMSWQRRISSLVGAYEYAYRLRNALSDGAGKDIPVLEHYTEPVRCIAQDVQDALREEGQSDMSRVATVRRTCPPRWSHLRPGQTPARPPCSTGRRTRTAGRRCR